MWDHFQPTQQFNLRLVFKCMPTNEYNRGITMILKHVSTLLKMCFVNHKPK